MKGAMTFEHAVLSNGLTVIGERNPAAASAAAGFFVMAGSRDETPEVSGVSHFLEHMLFKGNETHSADDFNRIFDELGARYNAFTNTERTVYFGAVLPDKLLPLLDLLGQLMRPSLRSEDFDLEKNVILEEIAMYEDRPQFNVFDLSMASFWNGHPLGNSVLGSRDSIKALGQGAMQEYMLQRYSASNQVLALTGNFVWDEVLERAEAIAGGWPSYPTSRERPAAQTASGRHSRVDPALKRTHVAYYAPGVGSHDARRYAAAILALAIGADEGSRLYWELVDKGLADQASLSHALREDQGSFEGYLNVAPERAAQVIDIYQGVLAKVQKDGLSGEEWRRAQRKLATSLSFRAETPLGRLTAFGTSYQLYQRYVSVEEVLQEALSATLADGLALLAERPFDRGYTFTLGPASTS